MLIGRASGQYFEAVLFDNGQQLERHTARPFGSGLPFLHRGFTGLTFQYGVCQFCLAMTLFLLCYV